MVCELLLYMIKKKKKLFLSRDRIGEKPLIYYYDNETFAFWSEINALCWVINKDISLNKEILSNFDTYNFRHIPSPTHHFNIFSNWNQDIIYLLIQKNFITKI